MHTKIILLATVFLTITSMARASENNCTVKLQVEDSNLLEELTDEETPTDRVLSLSQGIKDQLQKQGSFGYVISEQSDVILTVKLYNHKSPKFDADPWSFKAKGTLNGKDYFGFGVEYFSSHAVEASIQNLFAALPKCK